MRDVLVGIMLSIFMLSASAEDYARVAWFDYPDPTTPPRTTVSCAQMGSMDVPCPTWDKPFRMCRAETCTGHSYKVEMLRVAPTFVARGADAPDAAVRSAVTTLISACVATAVSSSQAAAAAAPSPEPAARIAAAIGVGAVTFRNCLVSISAAGVTVQIVKSIEFVVDMPTHWSPI